jgi:hypothetical protein
MIRKPVNIKIACALADFSYGRNGRGPAVTVELAADIVGLSGREKMGEELGVTHSTSASPMAEL